VAAAGSPPVYVEAAVAVDRRTVGLLSAKVLSPRTLDEK
jgi:hypothetical protein